MTPAPNAKPAGIAPPDSHHRPSGDVGAGQGRRLSARELFNRLQDGRRRGEPSTAEIKRPSIRALFNRLPESHSTASQAVHRRPSVRDLFNKLPPPPRATDPKPTHPSAPTLPPPPQPGVVQLGDDDMAVDLIPAPIPVRQDLSHLNDTDPPAENIRPSLSIPTSAQYIFNTTDRLSTRQTVRSWDGGYRPEDWVFQREDLHADQVDRDRILPVVLGDSGYPYYVGPDVYEFLPLTFSRPYRQRN